MVVSFKILFLVVGAGSGKLSGTMENVAPNALGDTKEVPRVKGAFQMYHTLDSSPVAAGGCIGLGGDQGQRLARSPHTHTCARKGTNNLIFLPYPFGNGRKADAKGARCDHSAGCSGSSLTTLQAL